MKPKPTRGWLVQEGSISNERLSVDNVQARCDMLLNGVAFDDPAPIAGDDASFYIKRLIIDCDVVCQPTALNQTGMLPFNIGVWTADQAFTEFASTNGGVNLDLLVDYETLLEGVARVLHVDSKWAYAMSAAGEPATALPDAAYHNRFTLDFSYKGGLNVRNAQGLYLALGQADWLVQTWLTGDTVILNYVARMLVQERRQR